MARVLNRHMLGLNVLPYVTSVPTLITTTDTLQLPFSIPRYVLIDNLVNIYEETLLVVFINMLAEGIFRINILSTKIACVRGFNVG